MLLNHGRKDSPAESRVAVCQWNVSVKSFSSTKLQLNAVCKGIIL